ncbi:MAG: hypothetical protein ACI4JA_01385, partial [Oscillospiraceae bacterium]
MNDFSYFSSVLDEVLSSKLDSYVETLEINEEHNFSEKYNKKIQKLIKRREKPYFNLICTAGRRAACIIVAIILISASALSVKAIREAIYHFIMKHFSDHTEITVDSGIKEGYPVVIENEYYISALTDEFEQVDYSKMENSITAVYFNDDEYIFFEQYTKDAYVSNYDNEHSEFELYTDTNGQEYMIYNTGHDYAVIWD